MDGSLVLIFVVWNTMMGASVLSVPWAINKAGFALGIFILIFMCGLCFYTVYRIVTLRQIVDFPEDAVEFPDFCRYLFGPWTERIATFFSLIPLMGAAIIYWLLMINSTYFIGIHVYGSTTGQKIENDSNHETLLKSSKYDDISNILHEKFLDVSCPARAHDGRTPNPTFVKKLSTDADFMKYWNKELALPFYLATCFAPLLSLKYPSFFSRLNALGIISVCYLLIFIMSKSIKWGIHFDTVNIRSVDHVYLVQITFPALMGTLSLAFFIHNGILSLIRNQKHPENTARNLAIAYALVGLTYLITGGVFIATFPYPKECIQDNILNNFKCDDVLVLISRTFLAFQILTVYPLVVYILRIQVMHFIYGDIYPSWKHVAVFNIFILTTCILFSIFLPNIGFIIRYCGATSGLAYIFTLPCISYMKALKDKGELTITTVIIHSLIIILGIFSFISQFFVSSE